MTNKFVVGEVYTCTPNVVDDLTPTKFITSLTGIHLIGYNNNDVKYIYIHNQTMQVLPKNLAELFPNLQGIQIQNSKFESLERADLEHYKDLRLFSSWFSNVFHLEKDLFASNLKIEWIAFYQSNIQSVGGNLIPDNFDISKITRVDFRNNPCVNVNVNSESSPGDIERLLRVRLAEMCPNYYITAPPTTIESTTTTSSEPITEPTITTTMATTTSSTARPPVAEDKCPAECLKSIDLLTEINDNLFKKIEILENEIENIRKDMEKFVEELKCKFYSTILTSTLSQCSMN